MNTVTGLTITNPLVLYRALVATKRISPDPAQLRLGRHRQSQSVDQILKLPSASSPKALRAPEGLRALRRVQSAPKEC